MDIEYKKSKIHNLGVFAKKNFKIGEIIEECPVLVLSHETTGLIDEKEIDNYSFDWVEHKSAIVLGYGSLYNHDYNPSARYLKDFKKNILTIKAIQKIKKGQEITLNYNGDPKDKTPVWFDHKN